MKEQRPIQKEHKAPEFQLVRQEEQNRIFFVASKGEAPITGGINDMIRSNVSEW